MTKDDEKKLEKVRYSLFAPGSKHALHADYPELTKTESFKRLKKEDQLFAWYYACKASPFADIDDLNKRVTLSLNQVYKGRVPARETNKYKDLDFNRQMKTAIDEIEKYEPGPRIRGKMMIDKMLNNLEVLVDIDATDESQFKNKDDEVDWSKKKAYIDSIKTATSILPVLISSAEDGFSVKEIKGAIDETDGMFIDEFHNNNQ